MNKVTVSTNKLLDQLQLILSRLHFFRCARYIKMIGENELWGGGSVDKCTVPW